MIVVLNSPYQGGNKLIYFTAVSFYDGIMKYKIYQYFVYNDELWKETIQMIHSNIIPLVISNIIRKANIQPHMCLECVDPYQKMLDES